MDLCCFTLTTSLPEAGSQNSGCRIVSSAACVLSDTIRSQRCHRCSHCRRDTRDIIVGDIFHSPTAHHPAHSPHPVRQLPELRHAGHRCHRTRQDSHKLANSVGNELAP